MTTDAFLEAAQRWLDAFQQLRVMLDAAEDALIASMVVVREGASQHELYGSAEMNEIRDALGEALDQFVSARAATKARAFQVMVEQEQMTPSQVGQLVQRPRQVVKRQIDAVREKG